MPTSAQSAAQTAPTSSREPLVEIKNLRTHFFTDDGVVKSVDDVSLTIPRGATLGLVGESGCGKSVTALSVIRLIAKPGRIVDGSILFHEESGVVDLATMPEAQMRRYRGSKISMIFQEPMTSLNPVFTVGQQIMESVLLHQKVTRREARDVAIEMLRKVKVPVPEQRMNEYPHQFSGGMRQRVMIAMSLACQPRLLIADEPTTALDVTIQAQILELLRELQQELGMSILIITHDLGVIAEMADDVAVMYASKVVEYASVRELFSNPRHPYTNGLFASRPKPGTAKSVKLESIPGMVPSPLRFPTGCKFHPRCKLCEELCRTQEPELRDVAPQHPVRCHVVEANKS
ncbi:MAG: ABC transporter ATP-binding protein [Planctomycetota bacterium]